MDSTVIKHAIVPMVKVVIQHWDVNAITDLLDQIALSLSILVKVLVSRRQVQIVIYNHLNKLIDLSLTDNELCVTKAGLIDVSCDEGYFRNQTDNKCYCNNYLPAL